MAKWLFPHPLSGLDSNVTFLKRPTVPLFNTKTCPSSWHPSLCSTFLYSVYHLPTNYIILKVGPHLVTDMSKEPDTTGAE